MPDINSVVLKSDLSSAMSRIKRELDKISISGLSVAFQSVEIDNGVVKFYATTDRTGNVVGSFDLPEEIFLDQAGTTLVENFAWTAVAYPNSTNPNLEGKIVLVLAVKGDKSTNPTIKYSFVDVSKLIDTYAAGDNSITISGYSVSVKISPTAGNLLSVTANGLFVGSDDTKVDKVTSAVSGNVAVFGTSGALADGGFNIATINGKVDKVTSAVTGNFVIFGASGAIVDSGYGVATSADITALCDSIFGAAAGDSDTTSGGGE